MKKDDLTCLDPSKPTIVFDCDGVLLNYDKGMYEWMKSNGEDTDLIKDAAEHPKNYYDVLEVLHVDTMKDAIKKFQKFNRTDYARKLDPFPDAVEFFNQHAERLKEMFNIVIVTAFSDSKRFSHLSEYNRIRNIESVFGNNTFDGIFFIPVHETKIQTLRKINEASDFIFLFIDDLPKYFVEAYEESMYNPDFIDMYPVWVVRDPDNCGIQPYKVKNIIPPMRVNSLMDLDIS